MSLTAVCPSCGSRLVLLDHLRGRRIECPDCGEGYVAGAGKPKRLVVLDDPEPEDDEPKVQCYDCRRFFPVGRTSPANVNVGQSFGSHNLGLFSGSSSAAHYAKVDLCRRCLKRRQDASLIDMLQYFVTALFLVLGVVIGFATSSVWVGLAVVFLGGAAAVAVTKAVMTSVLAGK